MRSSGWFATFLACALIGAVAGYVVTLIYRPGLIPPVFRLGGMTNPTTVLLMGTDVVYTKERRNLKADQSSYQGRSDTILLVRLDPYRNAMSMLQIPRDTLVKIPGYGRQKINGANAFGGPQLAAETVTNFTGVPIDHYVVLNVHGLVELVDELGGLTVDVPKRMHYVDHSAKLNIDLQPGPHVLNGTEAMGFVRFRHDGLGDIGRVQRQELFLKAVQDKAMDPLAWTKLPKLLNIASNYVLTDMDSAKLMQLAQFVRSVPKENQQMIMMPGHFAGTGDWAVDDADVQLVVSRLMGQPVPPSARESIRISVENASESPENARKIYKYLSARGYNVVGFKNKSDVYSGTLSKTRIIAQRGNTEEAKLVQEDLQNHGEIINASVGDIETAVTVIAGDDVTALVPEEPIKTVSHRRRRSR